MPGAGAQCGVAGLLLCTVCTCVHWRLLSACAPVVAAVPAPGRQALANLPWPAPRPSKSRCGIYSPMYRVKLAANGVTVREDRCRCPCQLAAGHGDVDPPRYHARPTSNPNYPREQFPFHVRRVPAGGSVVALRRKPLFAALASHPGKRLGGRCSRCRSGGRLHGVHRRAAHPRVNSHNAGRRCPRWRVERRTRQLLVGMEHEQMCFRSMTRRPCYLGSTCTYHSSCLGFWGAQRV